jgi:hypothetical protein
VAPWLLALAWIFLFASWRVSDRAPWIGPLVLLFGGAIGAQAVDGIRTGRVQGQFPNRWPLDAGPEHPIAFWSLVVFYFASGLLFAAMSLWMILSPVGAAR